MKRISAWLWGAGLMLAAVWQMNTARQHQPVREVLLDWQTCQLPRMPLAITPWTHTSAIAGENQLWIAYERQLRDGAQCSLARTQLQAASLKHLESWNFPASQSAGFLADGEQAVLAAMDEGVTGLSLRWTATGNDLVLPFSDRMLLPPSDVIAFVTWTPEATVAEPEGLLTLISGSMNSYDYFLWYVWADAATGQSALVPVSPVQLGTEWIMAISPDRHTITVALIDNNPPLSQIRRFQITRGPAGTPVQPLPPVVNPLHQQNNNTYANLKAHFSTVIERVIHFPLQLPVPYLYQLTGWFSAKQAKETFNTFRLQSTELVHLADAGTAAMMEWVDSTESQWTQQPDGSTLFAGMRIAPKSNPYEQNFSHVVLGYLAPVGSSWEWIMVPLPEGWHKPKAWTTTPRAQFNGDQVLVYFWTGRRKEAPTLYTASLEPWWGATE